MTIWTSLGSFTPFWILECLKHLGANFHPKGATWQYDHFLVLSGSLAMCTHMYTKDGQHHTYTKDMQKPHNLSRTMLEHKSCIKS